MFDFSDVVFVADVFKKTKEKYGYVNLMVNNAGILNETTWEKCVDTNLVQCKYGGHVWNI